MIKKADEWTDFLTAPSDTLIVPMTTVTAEFPRVAIALVEDSEEGRRPVLHGTPAGRRPVPLHQPGAGLSRLPASRSTSVPNELVGSETVEADPMTCCITPDEGARAVRQGALERQGRGRPDDLLGDDPFKTGAPQADQDRAHRVNAAGVEKDEAATVKETYKVTDEEFVGPAHR